MLLLLLILSYVPFVNSAFCVHTDGVSENVDVAGCFCDIEGGGIDASKQCTAKEVYCKVDAVALTATCSECKPGFFRYQPVKDPGYTLDIATVFTDTEVKCKSCPISVRKLYS